jgi:hypothetical protein
MQDGLDRGIGAAMAAKRKSKKRPGERASSPPPRSASGSQSQRASRARRPLPPPPTLQEELLSMAGGAARSLQQAFLALVVIGLLAGAGFGAWSLRPTPAYSAEELTVGSPFDVTFRAQNDNPWFTIAKPKFTCVVAEVRASGMPPAAVEATDVRFPAGGAAILAPGEAATFRCPFRSLIGHPINDDPAVAQRAEIYFRSEYDVELFRAFRLTEKSTHGVLVTRFLPPRWVRKP